MDHFVICIEFDARRHLTDINLGTNRKTTHMSKPLIV